MITIKNKKSLTSLIALVLLCCTTTKSEPVSPGWKAGLGGTGFIVSTATAVYCYKTKKYIEEELKKPDLADDYRKSLENSLKLYKVLMYVGIAGSLGSAGLTACGIHGLFTTTPKGPKRENESFVSFLNLKISKKDFEKKYGVKIKEVDSTGNIKTILYHGHPLNFDFSSDKYKIGNEGLEKILMQEINNFKKVTNIQNKRDAIELIKNKRNRGRSNSFSFDYNNNDAYKNDSLTYSLDDSNCNKVEVTFTNKNKFSEEEEEGGEEESDGEEILPADKKLEPKNNNNPTNLSKFEDNSSLFIKMEPLYLNIDLKNEKGKIIATLTPEQVKDILNGIVKDMANEMLEGFGGAYKLKDKIVGSIALNSGEVKVDTKGKKLSKDEIMNLFSHYIGNNLLKGVFEKQ